MQLKTAPEVFRNSKTKVYSDGSTNTIACRSAIFKEKYDVSLETEKNWEEKQKIAMEHSQNIIDYLEAKQIEYEEYCERKKRYIKEHPKTKNLPDHVNDVRSDSLKRAKDSIFDYILNNDFDLFFTGTINPEKLDSKSPKEVLKPVQKWLKNMVLRYNLSYIMIAEQHKSGAIHFHGLCKGDNLNLDDSGTKLYRGYNKPVSNERAEKLGLSDGRTVYNLKTWSFGFSTALYLTGDRMNTAFYVTKYITKDCKKIFGKFFWHSRDLKRPSVIIEDVEYDELNVSESQNGFKYIFKRGNEEHETECI